MNRFRRTSTVSGIRWAIYAGLAAALSVARISGPSAVWSGDSGGYKSESALHDWRRLSESFSGNSTRPWPIVLPFELIGDASAIVNFQFAIYGASSILMIEMWRRKIGSDLVFPIVAAVVVSSPFLISFNFQILSESLSLSMWFTYSALVAKSLSSNSSWRNNQLLILCLLWMSVLICLTRPLHAVVIGPVSLVVILRQSLVGAETKRAKGLWLILFVIPAVVCSAAYTSSYNARLHAYWSNGVSRETVSLAYMLSDYSIISSDLVEEVPVLRTPPACVSAEFPLDDDPSQIWTFLHFVRDECPEAREWAVLGLEAVGRFLILHPAVTLRYLMSVAPSSLAWPSLTAFWTPIPSDLHRHLLGSEWAAVGGVDNESRSGPGFSFPLLWFLPAVIFVARLRLEHGAVTRVPALNGFQRISIVSVLLLALSVWAVSLLLVPSTSLEMARLTMVPVTLFHLVAAAMTGRSAQRLPNRGARDDAR